MEAIETLSNQLPDPGILLRVKATVQQADGWARMAMSFAAGVLTVLAMAPFFFAPVLFLTIPVLIWLLDGAVESPGDSHLLLFRRAAGVGWFFGFGYFSSGLFWVGEAFLVEAEKFAWALPFAVTLLPAGLALFYGFATGLARLFWPQGMARALVLAATLSICEWLRGHILTGFPWNTLGYALTWPDALMQSSGLFGIYGLTIWAVVLAALPALSFTQGQKAESPSRDTLVMGVLLPLLILGLFFLYGLQRLHLATEPDVAGVKIRIVQVSVPQREKWLPQNQPRIFADHVDLSLRNEAGEKDNLAGITHVVWPEAAMPFLPLDYPEVLAKLGEMLPDHTYLVTGALRRGKAPAAHDADPAPTPDARSKVWNSLLVLNSEGSLTALYDKIHLVPFGEFLPAQSTLEAIGLRQLTHLKGGFASGSAPRPLLDIGELKGIAALICYEAIFPSEVMEAPSRPALYLNVTNDGWFGNTTGPRQHFHQARVRAVETGVPLVRAANNGISAMFDGAGRVRTSLGLNEKGVLDVMVPGRLPPPLYAQTGDWIFLVQLLLTVLAAAAMDRRRLRTAAKGLSRRA